ncbi:single-stranded DNA-binding protein [Methylocystis parvus]|uniref:Single-stranded DNA-binding protein n=1 Tax=Methylocystis parvus TaxID=134 RepID=A0A6B8M9D2_9HYPH|nr:single-stranded DNA-binding protein [Methylocystis parvus]QGM99276.1 single-stranded DNA-binding protein [Methylocystis parvus]WBK00337.1 single-stranded DNA-binding protein [Methylocystis parvus OBBP]
MAGSVNKVILVGNLGRDPEVRTFPSGDRVVSFSVATSDTWRDKATGERRERTEWHNVSVFNEALGKIAEQYCRKGAKIYLEGQLQTREYTDKDGNQRKATDVVIPRFRGELTLLDSKGGGRGEGAYEGGGYQSGGAGSFGRSSPMERAPAERGPAPAASGGRLSDQLDDDIPF